MISWQGWIFIAFMAVLWGVVGYLAVRDRYRVWRDRRAARALSEKQAMLYADESGKVVDNAADLSFDFCEGCGMDFIVFPVKERNVILHDGCNVCGGTTYRTEKAAAGIAWRKATFPERWAT